MLTLPESVLGSGVTKAKEVYKALSLEGETDGNKQEIDKQQGSGRYWQVLCRNSNQVMSETAGCS